MSSHPRPGRHHTLQGAGSVGRPLSNLEKGARFVVIVLARNDHKHAVSDPTAEQPFDRLSGGLAVRIQAEHLCDGLPDPSFRLGILAPATRTGAFASLRPLSERHPATALRCRT